MTTLRHRLASSLLSLLILASDTSPGLYFRLICNDGRQVAAFKYCN